MAIRVVGDSAIERASAVQAFLRVRRKTCAQARTTDGGHDGADAREQLAVDHYVQWQRVHLGAKANDAAQQVGQRAVV